jgi:hypothetical protein
MFFIFLYICIISNVPTLLYIDLGDFRKSLLFVFFYFAEHEILFCLFLNFLEPYGLQMDWGILKRFFFNKYKDSRLRS